MENKNALEVKNVSLYYEFVQSKSIKREVISSLKIWKKKEKLKTHRALNDLSFELKKGDTVGIIGRNGAGKSTLLRLIGGIFEPNEGEIDTFGNKVSLLALGTGFQAELSGIENIYLNGLLLGLTKKYVDEKLEDIIAFADIGAFIYNPVRTYSSGMLTRLAFSIAIYVNPDILLIDEVIGVGDEEFQRKSSKEIQRMIHSDKTVIMVSHSMGYLKQHCNKILWLEKGSKVMYGETEEVIQKYLELTK